jgi:hypothetical protein
VLRPKSHRHASYVGYRTLLYELQRSPRAESGSSPPLHSLPTAERPSARRA